MKIILITPDRGDRPQFLAMLKKRVRYWIDNSKHDITHMVVSYKPLSNEKDITQRYRIGYDIASQIDGVDAILFIENDDFYSKNYVDCMVDIWEASGCPSIFGATSTIYYHIGVKKYFVMKHLERASMMNTLIKPNLDLVWPPDNDPYTDIALWRQLYNLNEARTVDLDPICVGIKHGIGLTGGHNHTTFMERFIYDGEKIEKLFDDEYREFYNETSSNIHNF